MGVSEGEVTKKQTRYSRTYWLKTIQIWWKTFIYNSRSSMNSKWDKDKQMHTQVHHCCWNTEMLKGKEKNLQRRKRKQLVTYKETPKEQQLTHQKQWRPEGSGMPYSLSNFKLNITILQKMTAKIKKTTRIQCYHTCLTKYQRSFSFFFLFAF